QQDEDDEDDQRYDDIESGQRPLLVLEASTPHHLIALGEFHGSVDLLHRLRHEAAHVALAHAPLDRDAAEIGFPEDLGQALGLGDLGELDQRDALATGRTDRQIGQAGEWITALSELHDDGEAPFSLEELRDRPPLGRRFDGVLHVLDVDAVAGGRLSVDDDLELRLTYETIVVEVGHASHAVEHARDLASLRLQHEDVGAEDLDGELAFHAGQRLVHVVFDRLGEVRRDALDVADGGSHRIDELLLVAVAPLLTWLEPDVELG